MKHYIIDGNNLLGKDKLLSQLQKKDKQQSREKLAFMLSRHFGKKKTPVSLHFDGFEKEVINASNIRIIYSCKNSADDKIKSEIEKTKNPRNIILVTSDGNLIEFGRVCGCVVVKSEEFFQQLKQRNDVNEDQMKADLSINIEEYKKLFDLGSSDN